MKTCSKCSQVKDLSEFNRNKTRAGGYSGDCKLCRNAYMVRRYRDNAEVAKKEARRHRLRKYGLDESAVERMRLEQPTCPICSRPFGAARQPHIDHDHSTGRVRALLCGPCNRAIGLLQEDEKALQGAMRYLRVHKSNAGADRRAEG